MENNLPKKLSDREITEYTASLWRYKEIPPEELMKGPDPESHTIGNFQVIAARVRGKKHKHDGTNCDDWFETENIDGIFVSVVSDGAGSKKFSRIGSRAACQGAVKFLKKNLPELLKTHPTLREDLSLNMDNPAFKDAADVLANLVQDAVLEARQTVDNTCQFLKRAESTLQLKDFSCTFLLTVAIPLDDYDEMLVIACQVGDGITAAINTKESYENAVTLLGVPDSGQFSGETDFLTSSKFAVKENLMPRTKLTRKPIDLLVSMTDGVADDYDPNEVELRRLYFDLVANKILPLEVDPTDSNALEVPEPRYHSKLDGSETPELVPIQYTSELCETCNLTLKQLWENRAPLVAMANNIPSDKAFKVRLQEWLDNYTVRGSFDDRTLVLFRKAGVINADNEESHADERV